jgi:hypothetical protein
METVFSGFLSRNLVREAILGTCDGSSVRMAIKNPRAGTMTVGDPASQLSQTAPWGEVGLDRGNEIGG